MPTPWVRDQAACSAVGITWSRTPNLARASSRLSSFEVCSKATKRPFVSHDFVVVHVSSHGADWTSVQGGVASFEAQLLDDFLPESFTNFLGSVAREDRLVVLVANLEVTAIG